MCSYLPNPSHFETNSLQLHPHLSLVEAQPALVLEAVARSGFALEFASEQLRKDRSFVLQAAPWWLQGGTTLVRKHVYTVVV